MSEIRLEVGADTSKASADLQKFARDTGKELDQVKLLNLQLKTLDFENKIRQVKQQLKQVDQEGEEGIKLRVDLGELKSGLTEAKRQLQNYKNTGDETQSRLKTKFDSVVDAIGNQKTLLGGLSAGFSSLGAVVAGAFSIQAITSFITNIATLSSQLENARNAFELLFGSAEKANQILQDIQEFAKTTPFSQLGLVDGAKRLAAYGFTAEQVLPTLNSIGEAVSAVGGGQEVFNRVVVALGQIQTKGKLAQQELNQIAETGIPAFDILRDKLGLTQKELSNIGNAGIDANTAITALLEGFNERFGGSLEKQSKTLAGLFSNLRDTVEIFLGNIGSGTSDTFKNIVKTANETLQAVAEPLSQIIGTFITSTTEAIGTVVSGITQSVGTVLGLFTDLFNSLVGGFSETGEQAITTSQLIVNALNSVGVGIKVIVQTISLIGETFANVISALPDIAKGSLQSLLGLFKGLASAVGQIFTNLSSVIVGNIGKAINKGATVIDKFTNFINSNLGTSIGKIGNIASEETRGLFDGVSAEFDKFVTQGNTTLNRGLNTLGTLQAETADKYLSEFEKIGADIIKLNNSVATSTEKTRNKLAIANIKDVFGAGGRVAAAAGGGGGGGRGKSPENKELEERNKLIKQLQEEAEKTAEISLKKLRDSQLKNFSEIGKSIDANLEKIQEFDKEIEKINGNIEGLNKKLEDINTSTSEGIADRFVEIGNEIKNVQQEISDIGVPQDTEGLDKLKQLQAELTKLQQEQALARGVITEEEIARAETLATESETERLLRQQAEQTAEIQAQIALENQKLAEIQKARDAEFAIVQSSYQRLQQADQDYLDSFRTRTEEQIVLYNKLISKAKQLASLKGFIDGGDVANAQNLTNNNVTNNTTQNFNIANNIDLESVSRQLSPR